MIYLIEKEDIVRLRDIVPENLLYRPTGESDIKKDFKKNFLVRYRFFFILLLVFVLLIFLFFYFYGFEMIGGLDILGELENIFGGGE